MLGALLKQIVGGPKETPEEIAQAAYKAQKKGIGEQRPQLSDIRDEIGERLSGRVTTDLYQSLPQEAISNGIIIPESCIRTLRGAGNRKRE